ncbi:hypothetical protein OAN21_03100, partial [Alphaproteobacteria bacterium]|nr:hypothetical protein [Alphaproteobacteria bacterium]
GMCNQATDFSSLVPASRALSLSGGEKEAIERPKQGPDNFIRMLSDEILQKIFEQLPAADAKKASGTCARFYTILSDQRYEEKFKVAKFLYFFKDRYLFNKRALTPVDEMLSLPFMNIQLTPGIFGNPINLNLDDYTRDLPQGLFDILGNLRWLSLSHYTDTLPQGVFDKLESLRWLSLNDYTGGLPQGVFSDLGNLRTLHLANYTGVLPKGVFF